MNTTALLPRLFEFDKLPQAIILEGDFEHSEHLLKSLIKSYCCELKKACEKCQHCQLLAHGEHPDIIEIKPSELGHPIKVEQIRELNQWCQQSSHLLDKKLVIIYHADTMNLFSSNALLKTLEEPLSQVYFFLVVDNARALTKTISSRCWTIHHQDSLPLSIADLDIEIPQDHSNLLQQQDTFSELLADFIQGKTDLLSCIQFFDAYPIDEVLRFLQWMTQAFIHAKMLDAKTNYSIRLIAALPLQIWWKFWDKIEYYRCELQTKTNLQANLLLSELFTILLVL